MTRETGRIISLATLPALRLGPLFALFTIVLLATGCATDAVQTQSREAMESQIANATTPADHLALAAWYEQEAMASRQQAESHRRMIERYKIAPYAEFYKGTHASAGFVQQCQYLARQSERAAEADLALASLHRQMATNAKEQ